MKRNINTEKESNILDSLKHENKKLEHKIKALQRAQLEKAKIYNLLENILDTGISNKVLVDITGDEAIILGRPNVMGSSKKQMRHVTPYSFVEQLVKMRVESTRITTETAAKDLFKDLSADIQAFLPEDRGICLNEEQYNKLEQSFTEKVLRGKVLETTQSTYYLMSYIDLPKDWNKVLNLSPQDIEGCEGIYNKKKEKFINGALNKLQEAITDTNTYIIASEALARFMFTMFNLQPYTAFPEEGNSINYEIRVYNTKEDAQESKNKSYDIENSASIKNRLDNREDLSQRIRVVSNEGSIVQKVTKALSKLDNIIKSIQKGKIDLVAKDLLDKEGYNGKYNVQLKLTKDISAYKKYDNGQIQLKLKMYNEDLILSGSLGESISFHVAKQLYYVFDYKPLEEYVFVPSLKGAKVVKVYPSASGKKEALYDIVEGKVYRAEQENAIRAGDYNKEVVLRTEVANDIELLARKTIDHVFISILPYKGFTEKLQDFPSNLALGIFKKFIELVALDYSIEEETFAKKVEVVNDKAIFTEELYMDYASESSEVKTTGNLDGMQEYS